MFTKKKATAFVAAAFVLAGTSSALAGFVNPDVPDWRGDANTLYGGWESFTNANNAPNFAEEGNMGFLGSIYNFSGSAIIAGSGNIYDPGGVLNMHHYVQGVDGDITDAVINISTAGTDPNFAGAVFQWNGANGESGFLSTANYDVNFEQVIPQFGTTYNVSWTFDLSDIAAQVTDIGFIIQGTAPNMSYDAGAIDIRYAAVPAPGALALLGLAGFAGRRRRRG